MNTELIAVAKQLAMDAHVGQKYGEYDYYTHHLWVVANKVAKAGGSDIEISVAYLHDVLEDTSVGATNLLLELVKSNIEIEDVHSVMQAVLTITKREAEEYSDYIYRIKSNAVAAKVKYYDSEANMEACIVQGDYKRAQKYLKNLCELKDFA